MILTVILAGVIAGGMVFFAFFMAPLVFTQLPPKTAGSFIRSVFPKYYLTFGSLFVILSLLLFFSSLVLIGIITLLSGFGFIAARQLLMPVINKYSDLSSEGDANATRKFSNFHRLSVIINVLQMLVIFYVFYSLLNML